MDSAFHNAIAAGITAAMVGPGSANPIGGQFALIKTDGRRIDNMIVKAPALWKIAFGENPKTNYGLNRHHTINTYGHSVAYYVRNCSTQGNSYRDKMPASVMEAILRKAFPWNAMCPCLKKGFL